MNIGPGQIQFQIVQTVHGVQRQTDPIIKCIIDKKLKKLKKLIRGGKNLNGLYSCAKLNDDVTPLIAAVAFRNDNICSFLLKEGANPNIQSTNGWVPLHYATLSKAPVSLVSRLIAAEADPEGTQIQIFTPLQLAANNDREDIVKELMMSGACAERNLKAYPATDQKIASMIKRFSSESENFVKLKIFYDFSCEIGLKSVEDVFNEYGKHMLVVNPVNHLTLYDMSFNAIGPNADQYRQASIKWLRESQKMDLYIEEATNRLPKIPKHLQDMVVNCLTAVFNIMKEISLELSLVVIPTLLKYLIVESKITPQGLNRNISVVSILYVITQKTPNHKHGWTLPFVEELCKRIISFTDQAYLSNPQTSNLGVLTFGLFADLYTFDCVPAIITSRGISSVPEKILVTAEMEMDEDLKGKLRKLDIFLQSPVPPTDTTEQLQGMNLSKKKKKKKKKKTIQEELSVEKSTPDMTEKPDLDTSSIPVEESGVHGEHSSVKPFPSTTDELKPLEWHKVSERWRPQLEELSNIDPGKVYRLGILNLVVHPDFQIAKGSDGTEVFLGLKDDGTEVAVKRMLKSNYQALKREEGFLRLPQLDSPCIVRYVDFAEDEHFGYLVLQLCEYTLDEYIKDHLPGDKTSVLKKIVHDVLSSLSVLHSLNTKILHRDIKPQNVLIDVTGRARLADFGISRQLNMGQTTLHTISAGTKCWKARETLDEDSGIGYKRSTDIQGNTHWNMLRMKWPRTSLSG
ncbi:uncharacterized protein ACWYII_020051 isoform 2-T3 [Salvelinus alpinus]